MKDLAEKMTDEVMDPMTIQIAEETYTRYVNDYERDHPGAALLRWGDLDESVRLRWQAALAPVAAVTQRQAAHERELERLREELKRVRATRDRYHEQFVELSSALAEARVELSEAAVLGQCPARLTQALGRLNAVVAERRASA